MNPPLFRIESRSSVARPMALFENLGRATRRGIRKCPACGTQNGTRGLVCKNKACNLVFREKSANLKKNVTTVVVQRAPPKAIKVGAVLPRAGPNLIMDSYDTRDANFSGNVKTVGNIPEISEKKIGNIPKFSDLKA